MIQSSDSDKTFYSILDAGLRPEDIEISALGLEQAFVAITSEDDGQRGRVRNAVEDGTMTRR